MGAGFFADCCFKLFLHTGFVSRGGAIGGNWLQLALRPCGAAPWKNLFIWADSKNSAAIGREGAFATPGFFAVSSMS
jgi:hypothetical protein